jgi:hypothetical protein
MVLNVMLVTDTSGIASGLLLHIAFLGTDVHEKLSRVSSPYLNRAMLYITQF